LHNVRSKKSQKGMTLIEVAIVIVIMGILLGALYQIFITGNILFDKSQVDVNLLQNARVAMDWIVRDVRFAVETPEIEGSTPNNKLKIVKADSSVVEYYVDPAEKPKILYRSKDGSSNPITNNDVSVETITFEGSEGIINIKICFEAFNAKAKKKQVSISGNIPSFIIKGKVFVRKIILGNRWDGQ